MPPPVGKVKNILIPGPGGSLAARVYRPLGEAPEGGWPCVVYFHGGGWVIADLNTYDVSCRTLCLGPAQSLSRFIIGSPRKIPGRQPLKTPSRRTSGSVATPSS